MAITLEIKGLSQLISMAEKYPAIAEKHINMAINRSLVRLWGEEKIQAPVYIGRLRDDWKLDVGRFQGKLSSNAPYAMDIENGRGPHAVSGTELMGWAAKKGLNPWAVAKSITKKGTKANPFFARSINAQADNIQKEFDTALQDIIKEINS